MSLDVYLHNTKKITCTCGEVHELDEETVYDSNITHNLTEMAGEAGIYEALWRPEEMGATRAIDLIESLEDGLGRLKADPKRFKQFNPSNGWGDYDSFVTFVDRYLETCKEYPEATISVSR